MTMEIIRKPLRNISVTVKMVFLTVIIGLSVWAVLDYAQTRTLKRIFQLQLTESLSQKAMEDRLRFDRHIRAHEQLVRMIVSQVSFVQYTEKKEWLAKDGAHITYDRRPPPWFPNLSLFRSFVHPDYALLIDAQGRVREIYRRREENPPDALLMPTDRLLKVSHNQSFLTTLNGVPYLITSESTKSSQEMRYTLMLACQMDERFLAASQGPYHDRTVALVLGETPRILTSSNGKLIPPHTALDDLKDRFLVTGQEFFEYGDSELAFKFASFISTEEFRSLTDEIVSKGRQQRAIMAFMVIASFIFIMLFITKRIERLTQKITDFSKEVCYKPIQGLEHGDEFYILENRFQCLTEGVTSAHEIIKMMFSSYLPPTIVKDLIDNPHKARLGVEKRNVTIFFSDLQGFTILWEKLSPDEVVSMLNEYFKAMTDVIFRWEGTFDKIIGDEIMAFWGAPGEQPNHAELAVKCSLDMAKSIRRLRRKWVKEGKPPIECGMGINTGDVLVGNIGAEGKKMDYTIIGDHVNTASRVEALTRQYDAMILITEFTAERIKPLINSGNIEPVELIERGMVKVKEKAEEVRVYELRELDGGHEDEKEDTL